MRTMNKKIVFIYLLIFSYITVRILSVNNSSLIIKNELNVLIWLGIFLISFFLTRRDYNRYLEQYDKVQTTFIVVIVYLMIYFSLGLFLGYQHNAYSTTLRGMLNNTLMFMPIIVFQEYVRQVLVSYSGNKNRYLVVATILFILIGLNFNSIANDLKNAEVGFKFVCSDLIPLIASNVVFTYLAYISSCKPAIIYRLFTVGVAIYLPILPNINWFFTGVFGILVPMALYIIISYSQARLERKISFQEQKRNKPSTYIPMLVMVLIIAGFVVGFFKYQPIAVVSDSMIPIFARGDAIVIERIKENELDKIKVGTIIKFQSDNYHVVHRVHEIEETEEGILYITKGDNNNAPDSKKVVPDQIQGIYKFHVKYVGFPSVWLSELLR